MKTKDERLTKQSVCID